MCQLRRQPHSSLLLDQAELGIIEHFGDKAARGGWCKLAVSVRGSRALSWS